MRVIQFLYFRARVYDNVDERCDLRSFLWRLVLTHFN